HIPRYVRESSGPAAGSVIGLEIDDLRTGGRLVYVPCLASLEESAQSAARQADCLLLDGTFWDDQEPIQCGIGRRTARTMGHVPVSGPEGSLDWLSKLKASHRAYVHINNTNPMLNERSPEYRAVTECGVRVGADGDSFEV